MVFITYYSTSCYFCISDLVRLSMFDQILYLTSFCYNLAIAAAKRVRTGPTLE